MTKNDIPFLLSGGLNNTNPKKSLGGPLSNQSIDNEINNLFGDVTSEHSISGYTDYRCLYMINENRNEKLKDFSLYIHKDLEGAEITIGLALQSDVQALMVSGNPTSGKFQLQYVVKHANTTYIQTTREINWMPDVGLMSQRIAAILNSLDFLSGVTCTGTNSGSGFDFLITFGGESSGRTQELLAVVHEEGLQISIMSVTQGGPINLVAPNIGRPNNPPNGVTFFDNAKITPVVVGTLLPNDFIPVWLRRTVAKDTTPVHPDLFRLHIFGDALPVLTSKAVPDSSNNKNKTKSKKMYFQ